jgi:SAM-dependent methyltransferase
MTGMGGMMVDALAEKQIFQMITGYWISQIVGTAARLGIADCLARGPLRYEELAADIACDPDSTFRLLRACAGLKLVSHMPDGAFALAPLGEALRSDAARSMRDLAIMHASPGHWLPWGRLSEAVRSGKRQTIATLGQELFEYYADNPHEGSAFTGAMSYMSELVADEAANLIDTSSARHLVDVGGASGTMVAAFLAKNPALHGVVLDLPEVAPRAEAALARRGLSARSQVIGGDFFESVPEADIYVLKRIIHDWDDAQSIGILSNCARSLRPGGRVVLVESVLPEGDESGFAPLADLNMLVVLRGRERTEKEYRNLLESAGLGLDRVTDTASPYQIIEASRHGALPPQAKLGESMMKPG